MKRVYFVSVWPWTPCIIFSLAPLSSMISSEDNLDPIEEEHQLGMVSYRIWIITTFGQKHFKTEM